MAKSIQGFVKVRQGMVKRVHTSAIQVINAMDQRQAIVIMEFGHSLDFLAEVAFCKNFVITQLKYKLNISFHP